MPEIVGQRAIVIGAGIAGLTAARALSGSFAQVVILERDKLGPEAAPRTGVPQGKQPHALLVGGQRALSDQFPRFVEQLLKSGAVAYDYTMARLEMGGVDPLPQRDLGIPIYSASRPLIEHVIRHELKQIPNVTLQEQTRVEALTLSDSGAINGARYAAPGGAVDSVSADLIIDASGRGAPTMKLLAATGCARPETSSIGINIDYSTAIFAKPKDAPADWLLLATLPKAPQERRGGVIMPIEGNQWMVTLTSRHPQSPPPARMQSSSHLRKPATGHLPYSMPNGLRLLRGIDLPEACVSTGSGSIPFREDYCCSAMQHVTSIPSLGKV